MARKASFSPTLGMVLIRVVAGAILLIHGWNWLHDGGIDGRTVLRSVEASLDGLPAVVEWWGENVLLQNPDAFAFFWRWGALLCGLSLLLGGLTRPVGVVACVLLAHGIAYGPERYELLYLLLAVASFACAISGAGRRLGLDALFDLHFPAWVTWTRRSSSSFLS